MKKQETSKYSLFETDTERDCRFGTLNSQTAVIIHQILKDFLIDESFCLN